MPDIRCRGVCLTMNNGQIADTPVTVNAPGRQVIPVKGPVHRWIEPWYLAYSWCARFRSRRDIYPACGDQFRRQLRSVRL
jgi:hypothetical protein